MNVRLAMLVLAATLALSVTGSAHAATTSGPPASNNPDGVLPLLKGTKNVPLETPRGILAKLQKETVTLVAKSKQILESRDANIKKIKPEEVGAMQLHLTRLLRDAEHLRMWGEPSAVGYLHQLKMLQAEQTSVAAALLSDPFFKPRFTRALRTLHSRARVIPSLLTKRVDPLISRGKLEEALRMLEGIELQYTSLWRFYGSTELESERKLLNERWKKLKPLLAAARRSQVRRQMKKLRDAWLPDYNSLWRNTDDQISKLRKNASDASGPEILKRLSRDWANAQIYSMRCQALDWIIVGAVAGGGDATETQNWLNKQKELIKEHNTFTDEMADLVITLIEADTNRSTPEQIQELYPKYLESVSTLIAFSAIESDMHVAAGEKKSQFQGRIESALEAMAGRSDVLAQSIAEYNAATNELLDWRQKVAAAHAAKAQKTSYAPVSETLLSTVARSPDPAKRLLGNEKENLGRMAITTYGKVPTNYISDKLLGKRIHVSDGVGLRSEKAYPLKTRLTDRSYVGFYGKPDWLNDAVAHLKSDLLVNPQRPVPLTLDAQLALDSARRGDMVKYGGRIDALMLESVITRQASTQRDDWGMIRINKLSDAPLAKLAADGLKQVQLRLAVTPSWLQHKYFFVDLSSAGGNGG